MVGIMFVVEPGFVRGVASDPAYQPGIALTLIFMILGWLYKAGMESSIHQATLGKKALGLKVTDLSGYRVSFGTASLRGLPYYVTGFGTIADQMLGSGFLELLVSIATCVSCVVVAFTVRKQGLHDMVANCYVVRRPPVAGPPVRDRF